MRLINIAQRTVTVALDPEDCVLLARACYIAARYDSALWETNGPAPVLDALAFAFAAAAMAAQTANDLDDHRDQPVDLARVREQVQRFG